jgi:hypothetical protein
MVVGGSIPRNVHAKGCIRRLCRLGARNNTAAGERDRPLRQGTVAFLPGVCLFFTERVAFLQGLLEPGRHARLFEGKADLLVKQGAGASMAGAAQPLQYPGAGKHTGGARLDAERPYFGCSGMRSKRIPFQPVFMKLRMF